MMSLWDALRMNMMISYQELVRTFPCVLGYGGYKRSCVMKNNDDKAGDAPHAFGTRYMFHRFIVRRFYVKCVWHSLFM